jgi:hypothetical protein
MLISKNNAAWLNKVFNSNFSKLPNVLEAVRTGMFPDWVKKVKDKGFFKNIAYISEPIVKATNNFITKKADKDGEDLIYEWANEKKDFCRCFFVLDTFYFVEKIGLTLWVVVFSQPTASGFICFKMDFSGNDRSYIPTQIAKLGMTDDAYTMPANAIPSLLMFLHFVEMEEKFIKAKTKPKGISKKGKDVNLSDFDAYIVGCPYFTKIYVEGGFEVSGHWRLQPYGEGSQQRKMIYIQPYVKSGYTRRADIERNPGLQL